MATYFVLGKFNKAGAALGLSEDVPDLARSVAGDADIDVECVNAWLTMGPYDMLVQLEADALTAVIAFSMAWGTTAGVETLTLAADDDLSGSIAAAGSAHTRHMDRGHAVDGRGGAG